MPVGEYTKDQIRAMADEIGLLVAHKPDSQDICFVSDGDYASYIEENSDAKITPGNFVLSDGTVVGKHKGIIHYTVGQRKVWDCLSDIRCSYWRSARKPMKL